MGLLDALSIRKLVALERKFMDRPDQFILLRYLAIFCAVRYDSPVGAVRRAVWYCYRSVLLMGYATYFYKVYWTVTHWEYGRSSTDMVGYLWLLTAALARTVIFDRAVLDVLMRFFNDRTFRGGEGDIIDGRRNLQQWNNRFLIFITVVLLLETMWFLARNINVTTASMLVYQGQLVGGHFAQLLFGLITCCWYIMYAIVFAFIYAILNVFRLEMTILVQSFENLADCFERYNPDLHDAVSVAQNIEQEKTFWKDLQCRLKVCIQRHVDLLENLSLFCTILAPFSFVQYYGTFALVAQCCFVVAYDGVTEETIVYITSMGLMVLESFFFCRSIDILSDLHSSITTTLYNLEWHRKLRHFKWFATDYRQVQKTLLIVMMRSQVAPRLRITGHGSFSMNRFADLMNSSYSMLTLMLQLKSQTGEK